MRSISFPRLWSCRRRFENTRQLETRRLQAKLQSLSPEQRSAVENLTRGLMNKYLHQAVQAVKTAAREGDAATVKAICDVFAVNAASVLAPPAPMGVLEELIEAELSNAELLPVGAEKDGQD